MDSGQDTGTPLVDAATIMGTTPAALRKRLQRGSVPGYKRAGQWFVLVDSALPTGSPRAGHGQDAAREAVVSPQIVEQAITRTGQQYSADLRAMLGELRAVYEGQLAAKDETIAELRRRAEVAEAASSERSDKQAHAAQDAPGAPEAATPDNPSGASSQGFWARVRRVFGGT